MWRRDEKPERGPAPLSGRWWLVGTAKAMAAFLVVYVPVQLLAARFAIGVDAIEGESCLPYSVFLIDRGETDIARGDYVAFRSMRMKPFYADGTTAIKIAAGVAGDRVRVAAGRVSVNGQPWGELVHVRRGGRLWRRGRRPADFERDEAVPAGHLWVLATHERSYDSRYWGYVSHTQVLGRAYPIW